MNSAERDDSFQNVAEDSLSSFNKANLLAMDRIVVKREENFVMSLHELQNSIDLLKSNKAEVKALFQKFNDGATAKIKHNKEIIGKIDRKLVVLENKSSRMIKAINSDKVLKIEAFKSALLPLQSTADLLELNKAELNQKFDQSSLYLASLISQDEDLRRQLAEKTQILSDNNAQLARLRSEIEAFSKEHLWDFKEVMMENKTIAKLGKIKQSKKALLGKIQNLNKDLEQLNKNIREFKAEKEGSDPKDYASEEFHDNDKELIQLEEFLGLQADRNGADRLFKVLEKVANDKSCCLEDSLMREQVKLMESRKMQMIDICKNEESSYENELLILDTEIKELESEYFNSIKSGEKSKNLENELIQKRKQLSVQSQSFIEAKKTYEARLYVLDKWIQDNRKYLIASTDFSIPEDCEIAQDFLKAFISKPLEQGEYNALESTIRRYLENVRERNELFISVNESINQKNLIVNENLEKVKLSQAVKKTKEFEIESFQKEFEKLANNEKKLLKELESYKLEIDSGRKKILSDLVQQSHTKETHKTNYSHSSAESIKSSLFQQQKANVEDLRGLLKQKNMLKLQIKSLNQELQHSLKPQIESVSQQIEKKKTEIKHLEEDCIVVESSKEDLLKQIDDLAGKKKDEMIYSVKKLAQRHDSEHIGSIDKLYKIRAEKEAELIELEIEVIRQRKIASEKELEKSLEILKLTAKLEAVENECKNLRKNRTSRNLRMSMGDLKGLEVNESPVLPAKFKETSQSMMFMSKESIKESSFQDSQSIHRSTKSMQKFCVDSSFHSEVSHEIPIPSEPKYTCAEHSSEIEKKLFTDIFLLLEGSILYKKLNLKTPDLFDPLEFSVSSPEDCGYVLRKVKLNRQLTKLEIRQVGKPGVESSIMLDALLSISIPSITHQIIKAQNTQTTGIDTSLEGLAKHSKEYREMKYNGKISYSSPCFIAKSKETHLYPFFIQLKNTRVDLIADSLPSLNAWVSGISSLLKSKKVAESLRFKIQT